MKLSTTGVVAAALGTLLGASIAAAQADENMYNAERNLEAAWGQLQASPYDYHGHRDKALEHVGKALEEMRKAEFSYPSGKHEKKELKREFKEEEKQEKREQKLDEKERKREEKFQEHGY